jgi:hypothetical protein
MATINGKVLNVALVKALKGKRNIAYNAAYDKFKSIKRVFFEKFEEHKVTQEIRQRGTNISETLGGRGNLWGFIGFWEGSDPIGDLKSGLDEAIRLRKYGEVTDKGGELAFEFEVTIPLLSDLKDSAEMPFEGGKSWVHGIENGISGLSHFIYWKNSANSRSQAGFQADNKLRSLSFKPIGYLTPLLKRFRQMVSERN